jgi:hypothetical protein
MWTGVSQNGWPGINTDGKYQFTFSASDSVGNVQNQVIIASYSYKVSSITLERDTTAPTIDSASSLEGAFSTYSGVPCFDANTPPSFSIIVHDQTSGILVNGIADSNPEASTYGAFYYVDASHSAYFGATAFSQSQTDPTTFQFVGSVPAPLWQEVGDGLNYFTIYVTDRASNIAAPLSLPYYKDSGTPSLLITTPSVDQNCFEAAPSFQLSIGDITPCTVAVKADSSQTSTYTTLLTNAGGVVTGTLPQAGWWDTLGLGPHTLTFLVTNAAGTSQTLSVNIQKCQSLAGVSLTNPKTGAYGPNAPPYAITATYASEISAVTVVAGGITYTLPGLTGTLPQAMWSSFGNGSNSVTFNVVSRDGPEVSLPVSFEVVNVGPTITVISPVNGSSAGSTAPWVSLNVQDDRLDAILYSVDGGATRFPVSTSDTYFQIDQTAWDDAYAPNVTLTIYAHNSMGLWSSENVTIVRSDYINQRGSGISFGLFIGMPWQIWTYLAAVGAVVFGTAVGLQKRADHLRGR